MQYRQFGKTKEKISVLGFGCMRLPLIEDAADNSQIDEAKAIALIWF